VEGGWRRPHNEGLYNLHASTDIIWVKDEKGRTRSTQETDEKFI
jgi:hypothetical protein